MTPFSFDFTINIGTLLSSVTILGGGFSFLVATVTRANRTDARIGSMETQLSKMDKELEKQTEILVSLSAVREQNRSIERRLEMIESERSKERIANMNGARA